MKTAENNRTIGILIGIFLLGLSFFADWAFFARAHFDRPFGVQSMSIPITITGTNGSFGLAGLSLPIWFIITLGIFSLIFILLNQRGITSLPRVTYIAPFVVSALYMVVAISVAMFANGVHLRFGYALGLLGLTIGAFSGFRKTKETKPAATGQRP